MPAKSINDIISMSVGVLYIIPLILYCMTQNTTHLLGLSGLITTTAVSEGLKYFVIGKASLRPTGASNCNLPCNDGNQSGRPGMPSSHSAEAAFFTGFYIYQTKNPYIKSGLIVYTVAVMISRYLKRCHTVSQTVVGAALGFLLSASFIVLKKELMLKDI